MGLMSTAGQPAVLAPGREGGSTASRENNFNFLRLLLASSVIVSHSGEFIAGGTRDNDPLLRIFGTGYTLGDLAVDAFFIISGFLITKSWMSQPRAGAFLRKRVLRIYPGFIVAAILSEFVFGPLGGNPDYWAIFSPLVFLRRLVTISVPGEPNAFPELTSHAVNWAVWTIRYEFLCYLGVVILGSLGLFRHRRVILILWGLVTAYHVVQCMSGLTRCPGFTGPVSELLGGCIRANSMFLAGTCYYLYADRVRYSKLGVVAALCVLIPCMFQYSVGKVAFPTCGGYLLLAAAFAPSRILHKFGAGADISYGVYLYGWPIQQTIVNHFRQIDQGSLMVASLALSYVAGWLSWHLVEHRFLRLKPRPSPEAARVAEEPLILAEAQLEGNGAVA